MADEEDRNPAEPATGGEPVWEGQVYTSADGTRRVLRRRPPVLETRALGVEFDERYVLHDISLKVSKGETVAIIGESGCGKTVLLKNMIGLIAPTTGRVLFNGRDLATLSDKELTETRSHYGFVFQMAALFDSMTISENVAFPLRQHRKTMKRSEVT